MATSRTRSWLFLGAISKISASGCVMSHRETVVEVLACAFEGTREHWTKRHYGSAACLSVRPHHSKIVLGVLVAVLCLNGVAVPGRLAREREVVIIFALRIARRYVLAMRHTLTCAGRASALRPLGSLPMHMPNLL